MSKIIGILAGVGALNWLLVVLGFNLVEVVFRSPWLINFVYILVGFAGIATIIAAIKGCSKSCGSHCKVCDMKKEEGAEMVDEDEYEEEEKMM